MSTIIDFYTCLWCNQPSSSSQNPRICSAHAVCNRCHINTRTCQSACPCCWYENSLKWISEHQLCSSCGNSLNIGGEISMCRYQHRRCSQCSSANCILCQYIETRTWINSNFADLSADIQRVIQVCDFLEKKFEEREQAKLSTEKTQIAKSETASNICAICLDDLDASSVNLSTCNHYFHRGCIEQWFRSSGKQSCPTCGHVYGISKGPQPDHGQMTISYVSTILPGYSADQFVSNEAPTIEITYTIPSGVQGPLNSNPGQPYTGTVRKAYLPNHPEGKFVLHLLRRAFDDQHIFTVGRSVTTGRDNVVTWNDIHHKTSINGGPEEFGYPDPTYLFRVRQELADKGYK